MKMGALLSVSTTRVGTYSGKLSTSVPVMPGTGSVISMASVLFTDFELFRSCAEVFLVPALARLPLMAEGTSYIPSSGPAVAKTVTGEASQKRRPGRWHCSCSKSGVTLHSRNRKKKVGVIRKLLKAIPQNNLEGHWWASFRTIQPLWMTCCWNYPRTNSYDIPEVITVPSSTTAILEIPERLRQKSYLSFAT